MKIIYKKGNLLECEEKIIVHGVNCQGVMGAGVAKTIKEKYPRAFEMYRWHHENKGLKLGTCIFANCDETLVVNAITQEQYGRKPGTVYVTYGALRDCMKQINMVLNPVDSAGKYWGNVAAMPKIGAGLAGGNWDIIEKIIEEELTDVQPMVYYL